MADFQPFSRLRELRKRAEKLAERLEISPDLPDGKLWGAIGMTLAQKQREFSDFAIFDTETQTGPGRRRNRVNRDVLLSDKVAKHLIDNPTLKTFKAAVEDMREKDILPRGPKIETQLRGVERGNRAKRQFMDRIKNARRPVEPDLIASRPDRPRRKPA